MLADIVERYGISDRIYFAGDKNTLGAMEELTPNIRRVAIQVPWDKEDICGIAEKYHCSGVQFWLGMFDEELIHKLHDKGMFCNLFFADTEEDYRKYSDMGIDTVLTNRMDITARYKQNGGL